MSEDDRGRGILTPADREYLADPEQYSRQAQYNRNQAIRERIENAVLDFKHLAQEVDSSVYEDLFSTERDGADGITRETLSRDAGLYLGVAFLLRASLVGSRPEHIRAGMELDEYGTVSGIDTALSPFLRNVEAGVQHYINYQLGMTADVSVELSVENPEPIDDYAEQLDTRDEPVTGRARIEAASRLGRAGYSVDEIAELLGDPTESEADTDADDTG